MRTEQEMYDLILGVAKADKRVRAVLQNGSRSNPNVPKDIYQDFDIAYMVTDVVSFTKDHSWIDIFGKRLMLQMPETMRQLDGPNEDGHFGYLMLFEDGNRIDLSLVPINDDNLKQYDCLTLCLLDKDGIVPQYENASDKDFWVKPPDELFYYSCCNNFFWCLQNTAKGIARDELSYAMEMFNHYVRNELNDMVSYYIGINTDFSVSTGKMGKYFKKYLPAELYDQYAKTYSNSDYNNLWAAIFTACELFRTLAIKVVDYFGYTYNRQDDEGMIKYLNMVKNNEL